jgi:group II intron reverse transcriptase/maturase
VEGIRSVHSSDGQARERGSDHHEGADITTQPAKGTGAARTAETDWQTSLRAIARKAAQEKRHRFGGLYRLLNEANLRQCFYALRKRAAPGVDGVWWAEYEKDLDTNLQKLVQRLKHKSYHARLVKRQYIPKDNGKTRPLGLPVVEDKLVQYAAAEILSAIYEADFLPVSYGYRPNRGPLDAVSELTARLQFGRYEFVVEADIKGFFDHIQWDWLLKMLEQRIDDGALLGLIRKWLRAGVLEPDGAVVYPNSGTPQGGVISPVLANVYLHYVLDLWFEHRVRKGNRGQSELFRFADDFVACFQYRHEAEAFEGMLKQRLAQFGLEVASEKTKTLRFGRGGGPHNGWFDFLGFEFRWDKSREGKPIVKRQTSRKKLRSSVARFTHWIRTNRMRKIGKLMGTLASKYRGYWNYYGIIGNFKSLNDFYWQSRKILFKWLNRRSQKRSYGWRTFQRLLERYQIPKPRIVEGAKSTGALPSCRMWSMEALSEVSLYGIPYQSSTCVSEL